MDARVVDLSHHNDVRGFSLMAMPGSGGLSTRQRGANDYAGRRVLAERAGLLWGPHGLSVLQFPAITPSTNPAGSAQNSRMIL
jgi:hypothetical protein